MRKKWMLLLLLSVVVFAAGCKQNPQNPATAVSDQQPAEPESLTQIFDSRHNQIGAVDSRAFCTAADTGIFYSIFQLPEGSFTATAEYRFFRRDDGADIRLGTLENQGYEAAYTRTEHNGVFYTLAVTGNPFDDGPDTLLLLAFDTAAGTMKQFPISDHGFPYAAMAVSDGKLLIMNHEMTEPKCDKVYEFDPAGEQVKEILSFSAQNDSLRGVCAGEEGFCLLRLRLDAGQEAELFLDRYDREYRKVSERSLNETMIPALQQIPGIMSRQDALNELGMNVSRFAVAEDRYLVYENYGLCRVVLDLQTEQAVFAGDDNYAFSLGGSSPALYRLDFDAETAGQPEIQELRDGALQAVPFEPKGDCKMLQGVSRAPAGTWLLLLSECFPSGEGKTALYLLSD